jgi:glyoxalase family protein
MSSILGLHHITLVCSNAARTVNFYTRILGLQCVKKTVNFDDPGSYHLYFGDRVGTPGTVVTFFEWPHAPQGRPGIGGTHHFALTVADKFGLRKWKRRLTDLKIKVEGPFDRTWFHSIYFQDPDGVRIEIATAEPGIISDPAQTLPIITTDHERRLPSDETWPEPVPDVDDDMSLHAGMHHISAYSSNLNRTHQFYGELLGLNLILQTMDQNGSGAKHWFWSTNDGQPGSLISYFEFNPEKMKPARIGIGQTHHFAFAVADEASQLEWREKLLRAGLQVSPVMNRIYFKSIYSSDPDGHIVELATLNPGFLVDESKEELGQHLSLPPWLESARTTIEKHLAPIQSHA